MYWIVGIVDELLILSVQCRSYFPDYQKTDWELNNDIKNNLNERFLTWMIFYFKNVVFKIGIEDLFKSQAFTETSNLVGLSANSSIAIGEYLILKQIENWSHKMHKISKIIFKNK